MQSPRICSGILDPGVPGLIDVQGERCDRSVFVPASAT
jgi:hypothetical protein